VISFALMELNCPSYDYVLDMTWAEFRIRSFAYRRMQEREELLTREVAWASYVSANISLKKIPSKDKWWQIGAKNTDQSDRMKEAIKKAQDNYFKELKQQKNG